MDARMHFRKRQLLQYQMEASSSQSNDPKPKHFAYNNEPPITYEYPSSPSSMGSDKSSPTKCDINIPIHDSLEKSSPTNFDINIPSQDASNAYEKSIQQMQILARSTNALLKTENSSPKSKNNPQNETQFADAIASLEKLTPNNQNINISTLILIASQLKQNVEEYINRQITRASDTKTSSSAIILAKLNKLKIESLLLKCPAQISYHQASESDQNLFSEDLSVSCAEKENQLSGTTEPSSPEDMVIEESNLIIAEPDIYISSDDDAGAYETIDTIDTKKQREVENRNRVFGIFASINQVQLQYDAFVKEGVEVYEKEISKKSKEKSSKKTIKSSSSSSSSSSTLPSSSSSSSTLPSPSSSASSASASSSSSSSSSTSENISIKPLQSSGMINQIPWSNGKVNKAIPDYPIRSPFDDKFLIIGPRGTTISKDNWSKIDWDLSPPAITRKILVILFDRDFLSTHSLTGRPSPAFLDINKPAKKPLDPYVVSDIVDLVTSRTIATPKEIRMAITTKCADEAKLKRWRDMKQINNDKENIRLRPY